MIQSVPQIQSKDRVQNQTQQNIVQTLNKLLDNPIVQGTILSNVSLIAGSNVIPHGLDRKTQGWVIVDQDASSSIYRSAPFNAQNLTLTSSAATVVSLYVF